MIESGQVLVYRQPSFGMMGSRYTPIYSFGVPKIAKIDGLGFDVDFSTYSIVAQNGQAETVRAANQAIAANSANNSHVVGEFAAIGLNLQGIPFEQKIVEEDEHITIIFRCCEMGDCFATSNRFACGDGGWLDRDLADQVEWPGRLHGEVVVYGILCQSGRAIGHDNMDWIVAFCGVVEIELHRQVLRLAWQQFIQRTAVRKDDLAVWVSHRKGGKRVA